MDSDSSSLVFSVLLTDITLRCVLLLPRQRKLQTHDDFTLYTTNQQFNDFDITMSQY